jgi:molybdopterin-guanine dinucleotide biosynthesis protein
MKIWLEKKTALIELLVWRLRAANLTAQVIKNSKLYIEFHH